MSKAKQAEENVKSEAVEAPVEVNLEKRPCVYCGPSVRGVARQYTVYSGEIPAELKDFIGQHPAAKSLLVPVERFAQTRRNLETVGTVEAILFHKIKSEL